MSRISLLCPLLAMLLILFVWPAGLQAQEIQLSTTQRQMLNSLPPAQRQEALKALDELNRNGEGASQSSLNEPVENAPSELGAMDFDRAMASLPSTAEPRSRLVINFAPRKSLTSAQLKRLQNDKVMSRLIGSHHFVLDDSGVLTLQGLEMIPLLGLSEADINRRLSAEPYLAIFDIDAHILGQQAIGVEALQPFGYDVFAPRERGFDAPGSGPVPADYILGPGDTVRVQLFGNINEIYEYEVSRDGVLNLPEIGPVTVAGLSFVEFRADLDRRVKQMLIGTQVSVTMGQLRTIRVFVLGDVNAPGSYVVNGLATISSALYSSGGVSTVGSLRDIQLKRSGKIVARFDAYDFLIRGDTSGDSRLRPGDVIFVPPIGTTVAIAGAVNRPAIYEVRRLTSAADLVGLAGGLRPEAFADGATIERIDEVGERTVFSVSLANETANQVRIRTGDTLLIPEVLPELQNAVTLAGHVHRPGSYPWKKGMRLTDLVPSRSELKPGVDDDYLLIRRETERGDPLDVLSASLGDAFAARGSEADLLLQPGDIVNVFSLELGRQRVVAPLLEELKVQSTIDNPVRQVEISGNVRAPGVYPLEAGMTVSDLLRAGGNLAEHAYTLEAELTRYDVAADGNRKSTTQKIDLESVRRGDEAADLQLREHDYLIVKRIPDWDTIWTVSLEGEVKFPGEYRAHRGETLAELIDRAGGFTEAAFPEGAVFVRESLKEREQEQIETLARRMEADLAALSLQSADSGGAETLSTGNILLEQLRNTEAVGRLVIDLNDETGSSATAITVRDGDRLMVPMKTQVVTVLGETQQNTSHLYRPAMSRNDYIDLSGGLTRRADKRLIYVVRANGAVVPNNRSRWFGRSSGTEIRPGDTIVVPLDTDRMRPLTFWGSVTQILYQGAIAVAAVRTFD